MIERLKIPQPANDNYSRGELEAKKKGDEQHERRKQLLLSHSGQIQRTRDWLKEERVKLSSQDTAEGVDEHMQVIGAAFSAVDDALKDADEALEMAEQDPNDSAALALANVRIAVLEGVVEEAQEAIGN